MQSNNQDIKKRTEVLSDDKWSLISLYPSHSEWEKSFESVFENQDYPHWPALSFWRGRLGENVSYLSQTLDRYFDLARAIEKLYTYSHLCHDEEISEDVNKVAYQRALALLFDFQQESAWIEPELLTLSSEYLNSHELEKYKFYIEKIIRKRAHTLTPDKEELMAIAGKPLNAVGNAFSALNNADIKFEKVRDSVNNELTLSHALYQIYLRSEDRELRRSAFKNMHGAFSSLENTFSELLFGEVQGHIFQARARNYKSCVEAALFQNNIPLSVYRSLIEAVKSKISSLHKYVSMRKRMLKLDELHLYDMYVPLVQHVDINMSYKEAEGIVIESVSPLGADYQNILRKGLAEERWVDKYENLHKRSGAYSSGCYDSFPYILMNFRGILRDTFTLAHEAGHSMHSYFSNKSQPYHYSRYPIFVAEVASTFNEELLMHLMLKRCAKKEERLFLINEKLEDIRATLFRQTMFAEFELTIHEEAEKGTPLTPALLKSLYRGLNKNYFGNDIVIDSEIDIEWARIPHFYYNFYVYQYATGISAALSLAKAVLDGDSSARDLYISFLRGGSSLYPIDLLKLAGIDMTTPKPIEDAIGTFDRLISEFDSLSGN